MVREVSGEGYKNYLKLLENFKKMPLRLFYSLHPMCSVLLLPTVFCIPFPTFARLLLLQQNTTELFTK